MKYFEVFEESTDKRRRVIDPVVYVSSERQEELIKAGRYRPSSTPSNTETDGGGEETPIIIFEKMIYFSDDGSKFAYYTNTSEGKFISIYSANYANNTKTRIKKVNIDSSEFTGKSTEKCFVSNDGNYFVLSAPSVKTVYFYDVQSSSLLQTITDDQPNFGSLIAADADLKGLVVSTNDLQRGPTEYDVRSTTNMVSSIINYYKRNFNSENTQKFIKIHSRNAHANITDNSIVVFPLQFPFGLNYDLHQIECNNYYMQGIFRTSDIASKNNNFSLSCLCLKDDQLLYKSRFLNYDSSRYFSVKDNLTVSNNENYFLKFSKLYSPGQGFFVNNRNDSYYNTDTYKINVQNSCCVFSINRELDESYILDNSVYSSCTIPSNLFIQDGSRMGIYGNNFNKKHLVYYFFIPYNSLEGYSYSFSGLEQLLDLQQQQILTNNVCMNSTYVYNVCLMQTNNIKNLRIHRYPINSVDNLNNFYYLDYSYDGSSYSIAPDDPSIGLIKIIFSPDDRDALESSFLTQEQVISILSFDNNRIDYDKPFLTDPVDCGDCEFAYELENNIFKTENIKNVYCSEEYIFINYNSSTIILKIENDTCKSIKYVQTVNSLFLYNFFYDESGEYFSYENKIYKLDRNNFNLLLIVEL